MRRIAAPFGLLLIVAGMFALGVSADSTITVPVPEKAMIGKQVTLSLRIPPNTSPLTQKPMPALTSRKTLHVWNSDPMPDIPIHDEVYEILKKFLDKGWIKGKGPRTILKRPPVDRVFAMRVIEDIIKNILDVAQAPNIVRMIRKINLEATDVEDLRRMIAKYNKDLIMMGVATKKVDQDLLMFQERIKTAKSGVLKVIKVEGTADGATIIHLNVD